MKQGRNTAGTLTITGGDTARTGRYVSQAEKAAVRAEQSAAVAEAWAVGEKGGAPVGSTDETFHNNARHFAEQAAASVTFAQAARTAAESAKDDAEAAADSVTGSAAQIQSNKQDVHDLKSALNTKAPLIINSASGAIASFDDGADGMPLKGLTVNIEPVQAAGTPTPETPLPISGWTGCNVSRSGKNLLDPSLIEVGSLAPSDVPSADGDTRYRRARIGLNAGTYTFSTSLSNCMWIRVFINGVLSQSSVHAQTLTIKLDEFSTVSIACREYNSTGITDFTAQIELGSAATSYESFVGNTTYPIAFPTEAGTVYGGTLTVNADGSADVVSTMGNIASYAGETLPGAWISSMDVYVEGATPTTGAQVVYELEEPVSYHLDDVGQLKTFLGVNNIWADTGDVEVIYPADIKLYIDNKFAELQALVLENIGG